MQMGDNINSPSYDHQTTCHFLADRIHIYSFLKYQGISLNLALQWRVRSAMASQITWVSIVCLTVFVGADQRKHQSSTSLTFMRGTHRWPLDSPHKGRVTQKMCVWFLWTLLRLLFWYHLKFQVNATHPLKQNVVTLIKQNFRPCLYRKLSFLQQNYVAGFEDCVAAYQIRIPDAHQSCIDLF